MRCPMFTIAPLPTTPRACAKLSLRSCCLALPLVAALLAGTSLASADSITFNGVNSGDTVGISGSAGGQSFSWSGVSAGQFRLYDNTTQKSLVAWCLDVIDEIASRGTYAIGTLMTTGIDHSGTISQN